MSDRRDQDRVDGHGGEAEQYGPEYYRTGLGPLPYDRSEPHWGEFFGKIADDIIRVFRPRTAFDAGCAKGFLVEALWDRGVEARGRDISNYAISQVRSDIAAYCEAGSLAEPIEGRYDLVINIEVLEHMTEANASKAIANMAAVTDRIVFSSSPDDFAEATHVNVKPTIYWLKQFRNNGFAPVVDLTLPAITVYALAYERRAVLPLDEELTAVAEIVRLRMSSLRQTNKIGLLSAHLVDAQRSMATQHAEAQNLHVRLANHEEEGRALLAKVQAGDEAHRQLVHAREAASAAEKRADHLNSLLINASAKVQAGDEAHRQLVHAREAASAAEKRADHLNSLLIKASAKVAEMSAETSARVAEVSAEASAKIARISVKHALTLGHLNAKIVELIRTGLAHAERIENLRARAGRAEAEVTRANALVSLHRQFLVDFAQEHSEALATIDATSKALHDGADAYSEAMDRLHMAGEHLVAFEHEIASLRASTSWRVTSPLRKLRGGDLPGGQRGRSDGLENVTPFPSFPSSARDEDAVPADFDAAWYAEEYADVAAAGMVPSEHYRLFGKAEGRLHRRPAASDDAALFDGVWYLAEHADVASAEADPLQHFLMHGQAEGRPGNQLSGIDPMRAAAIEAEGERSAAEASVWAAAGFDPAWYAAHHGDVASDPDPVAHYLAFGLREGRPGSEADLVAGAVSDEELAQAVEPTPLLAVDGSRLAPELDREWYSANNKDVRESGGDPELHYVMYGKAEGRAPSAAVAEQRRVFRLQDFCNPYEPEVFAAEADPDFFVSILTPTYNTAPRYLRELYRSIANQRYGNWEWVVVDDGSTTPATLTTLRDLARSDERIRLIVAARNTGISGASNTALQAARGTHCALVDHDDLLSRDALVHIHREWKAHKDAQLFYTDECKLLADGSLDQFWAKPAWSPAYLENTMCIGHLSVYETGFLRSLDGFRSEYDGTQDYDLALRASLRRPKVRHIPVFAYLWRIIPGSSAADLSEKSYAVDRQRRAVLDYARQVCFDATVTPGFEAGYWRIRYPLAVPPPLLSYVIPTGAGQRMVRGEPLDLITNCIRSFDAKSFYPNREYIVVHNGDLSDTQTAALRNIPRLKLVLYDAHTFNFSEKLNLGVSHASGEYLCLVNDDVEAITPYGGEQMVSYLAFSPKVGCIGPLCLREDDRIQQNGVMFLPDIGPVHAGDGEVRTFGGHQRRLNCRRESVVIGGAMMIVRKQVFDELGGYDVDLPLNYNDVDFGLRLARSGLTSVVDPGIEVYHFESSTKIGTTNVEQEMLFARGFDLVDPYFSPWFDTSNARMQLRLRWGASDPVYFGPWLDRHIGLRSSALQSSGRVKFTVAVPVFNQPLLFLREMYKAFRMQTYSNAELVIFDDGSTAPDTVAWFDEIEREGISTLIRSPQNLGIAGANRCLLAAAKGDFFVPVDADDFISVDALQVMAHYIEKHPTRRVFYSDEYKSNPKSERFAPFFKPDFDPVLFMNCCYPTHLMAMDVRLLREIGAYSDDTATWCHDWDSLARVLAHGEEPVHVPELLYAWRINPGSTASAETGTKPGTVASQKFVLQRLLAQRGLASALRVEPNKIETSSGMWRLVTDEPVEEVKVLDAALVWAKGGSGIFGLRSAANRGDSAFVAIMADVHDEEALLALSAVARLDVRIGAVSGLVLDGKTGGLKWSGGLFVPGSAILDPYAGHQMAEGGYHAQLWCQRCVDVAAPVNVLIRTDCLRDALAMLNDDAGSDELMVMLGILAKSTEAFIAVTPHLLWVDTDAGLFEAPMDRRSIMAVNDTLTTGGRWYSQHLSIDLPYTLKR